MQIHIIFSRLFLRVTLASAASPHPRQIFLLDFFVDFQNKRRKMLKKTKIITCVCSTKSFKNNTENTMEVRQLDRHSGIQETERQDYLNAHWGLSGVKQDKGVDNLRGKQRQDRNGN